MSDHPKTTVNINVPAPAPAEAVPVVVPTAPGQPAPESTITVPNVTRITVPPPAQSGEKK